MIGYEDLLQAKPKLFSAAGEEWTYWFRAMQSAAAALQDEVVQPLTSGWPDPSGIAAWAKASSLQQQAYVAAIEFEAVSTVLENAGPEFALAVDTLGEATTLAAHSGLSIDAQGTAWPPPADSAEMRDPIARQEFQKLTQQCNGLIQLALQQANAADQLIARELDRLAAEVSQTDPDKAADTDATSDLNVASLTSVQAYQSEIIQSTDPAVVAAWWAGLSPAEQQKLELAAPAQLYSLPGIPDSVKADLAGPGPLNRVNMVQYALDHYNDSSIVDVTPEDDCADFVSHVLAHSGYQETGNWQHGGTGWSGLFGHHVTASYDVAGPLYDYMMQQGSTQVSEGQVRPGDLVFWQQAGANPESPGITAGQIHHVAVVTAVIDGRIYYTEQSASYAQASLDARNPLFEQGVDGSTGNGPQNLLFVSPAPRQTHP